MAQAVVHELEAVEVEEEDAEEAVLLAARVTDAFGNVTRYNSNLRSMPGSSENLDGKDLQDPRRWHSL
jgi:hypothetical protein